MLFIVTEAELIDDYEVQIFNAWDESFLIQCDEKDGSDWIECAQYQMYWPIRVADHVELLDMR
ncbi:hypothetical protein [Lacipirellula parvula]|uniref:Uncharacterized protein n=1 Tax=Lacipirellula parvula TaxID=2650471 RepID=A0A5K7XHT5_9BACT|nr:hypothetical protein [Lacipirellula parvula]BBO32509.1 hypothetical protein PLANPX_2121 [Lacipirellula parvula]